MRWLPEFLKNSSYDIMWNFSGGKTGSSEDLFNGIMKESRSGMQWIIDFLNVKVAVS